MKRNVCFYDTTTQTVFEFGSDVKKMKRLTKHGEISYDKKKNSCLLEGKRLPMAHSDHRKAWKDNHKEMHGLYIFNVDKVMTHPIFGRIKYGVLKVGDEFVVNKTWWDLSRGTGRTYSNKLVKYSTIRVE